MRCILINQFHPPAVAPTGQVMADLARTLAARGHEVVVLCADDGYDDGSRARRRRERVDGYIVVRLGIAGGGRRHPLARLAGYASFAAGVGAWLASRSRAGDIIVPLTTPPYLGLVARLAAARGARLVHWIMDLYPDVLAAHGLCDERSLAYRVLAALARLQWGTAALVLGLGPVMERRLRRHLHSSTASAWVPLWGDATLQPVDACDRPELVLLYSGNLGLGHRCQEFLAVAAQAVGTRWIFSGGGARRREVDAFVRANPLAPIETAGYVPLAQLRDHLGAADVHLASLDPAWQGCMVPSKLPSSFRVGRPVIFVGGEDNEIARWIRASGGGWVVDCNDLAGLRAAVEAARDPVERRRRGRAALAFAREHFERECNCRRIAELIEASGDIGN
jgi:colanic acid biosynthesis glycosyl transferase WcaI